MEMHCQGVVAWRGGAAVGVRALAVMLALGLGTAQAQVTQWDSQYNSNTGRVSVPTQLLNGSNFDFNEARISDVILLDLAQQLHNMPHNQAHYTTVQELMNDWAYGVSSGGNVQSGWNMSNPADGDVEFTQSPFGNDIWAPGRDLTYFINIPSSQLSPHFDPVEHRILAAGAELESAFVGAHDQWNYHHSSMHRYVLSPEPLTGSGTPYSWYFARGVTSDLEYYDTTDFNLDGFTGREKYLMNVDDLYDVSDVFSEIGLRVEGSRAFVLITHSKVDRLYRVSTRGLQGDSCWESVTESLGTGGRLELELPGGLASGELIRASVGLP